MILTIDPGTKHAGVACWFEYQNSYLLHHAFLAVCANSSLEASVMSMPHACCPAGWPHAARGHWLDQVVVELPQVYTRDKSKGNPNDLIKVAAVAGALLKGILADRQMFVLPAEWKGNAPKEVTENRCRVDLSAEELDRVELPAKSLQHNVWDAIGIGLWFLKKEKLRGTSRKPPSTRQPSTRQPSTRQPSTRQPSTRQPSTRQPPTSSAPSPRRSSP